MVEQTDEEFIAEIAALAEKARAAPAAFTAAGPRIRRLLAIIERLEKERDAALAKVERMRSLLMYARDSAGFPHDADSTPAALKAKE